MNIYVFKNIFNEVMVTVTSATEFSARQLLATCVKSPEFYRIENKVEDAKEV